ncbi:unnamed protein product [Mycena citricolor]|uniref:Uncharacterized protein n=1 Tax=Mycena citricolor TaxID=2018698 RepID=A0AAD2HLY8_9AGAR|nr:unnamed protein product [Mycena citricolor]
MMTHQETVIRIHSPSVAKFDRSLTARPDLEGAPISRLTLILS